jgi:acyl-CoA synthetase (NDP forming)
VRNPVDITAASRVSPFNVMRVLARAPYIDGLILVTTLGSAQYVQRGIEDLRQLASEAGKPLIVYTYTDSVAEARLVYRDLGLPLYSSSRRAAKAMAALRFAGKEIEHPAASAEGTASNPVWPESDAEGRVSEYRTSALLRQSGFPVAVSALARTQAEAAQAAAAIGGPVAMKLQAPSLAHKSSRGAVLLGVTGAAAVREGFSRLMHDIGGGLRDTEGVLIQEMISGGLEMLVGIDNQSGFGPLVMVGFGGPRAERLADVTMEMAPVSAALAGEMVNRLRLSPLLDGLIGGPAYDKSSLVDFIVRISEWGAAHAGEVQELDINPLIVSARGVMVADSLLVRSFSGGRE